MTNQCKTDLWNIIKPGTHSLGESRFTNNLTDPNVAIWVVGDSGETATNGKRVILAERIKPGESAQGDAVIIDRSGQGNFYDPKNYVYKGINGATYGISKNPEFNDLPTVTSRGIIGRAGEAKHSIKGETYYYEEMSPEQFAHIMGSGTMQNIQVVPRGQGACSDLPTFTNSNDANSTQKMWVVRQNGINEKSIGIDGKQSILAERLEPGQTAQGIGMIVSSSGNLNDPNNRAYIGQPDKTHTMTSNQQTMNGLKPVSPTDLINRAANNQAATVTEVPHGQKVYPHSAFSSDAPMHTPTQPSNNNAPQPQTPLTYPQINKLLEGINATIGANSQTHSPQSR